jgi:DNA-directed RNA polymerase specialized sigma24 family protein
MDPGLVPTTPAHADPPAGILETRQRLTDPLRGFAHASDTVVVPRAVGAPADDLRWPAGLETSLIERLAAYVGGDDDRSWLDLAEEIVEPLERLIARRPGVRSTPLSERADVCSELLASTLGSIRRQRRRRDEIGAQLTAWRDEHARASEVGAIATPLRAWLLTVIDRRLVDLRRREVGRAAKGAAPAKRIDVPLDDAAAELVFRGTGPATAAERNLWKAKVQPLLDAVFTVEENEIFRRYLRDESYDELAGFAGLADANSAERLIRKLKERLRRHARAQRSQSR